MGIPERHVETLKADLAKSMVFTSWGGRHASIHTKTREGPFRSHHDRVQPDRLPRFRRDDFRTPDARHDHKLQVHLHRQQGHFLTKAAWVALAEDAARRIRVTLPH